MRQAAYDWTINVALRLLLGLARLVPYRARVPLVGKLTLWTVAPVAGYLRRSRANLDLIFPEMYPAERDRIARASVENAGRTFVEIFSGRRFIRHVGEMPASGHGLAAVAEAQANGRPVILISGHFGNYDVLRAHYAAQGIQVGGLYKPLSNEAFNEAYVAAMSEVNGPMFERGRRGLAEMVAHLKSGGILGVLFDQRMAQGEPIEFLGHPALTALSAADLALKYDAVLVPVYGLRQPDGLSLEFVTEAPVPHTDARAMMQAVSDSLSARVRANPEQYFWIHRRWKP